MNIEVKLQRQINKQNIYLIYLIVKILISWNQMEFTEECKNIGNILTVENHGINLEMVY